MKTGRMLQGRVVGLRSVVKNSVMFCPFLEIDLRGHRELESKRNKCNFLELLDLVCKHDSVVKSRLSDGPKNAMYTCHTIKDDSKTCTFAKA